MFGEIESVLYQQEKNKEFNKMVSAKLEKNNYNIVLSLDVKPITKTGLLMIQL